MLDFNSDATLETLASCWLDRILYVARHAKNALGLSAILLRPDGIVAWVSEEKSDVNEAAQATARWFGEA